MIGNLLCTSQRGKIVLMGTGFLALPKERIVWPSNILKYGLKYANSYVHCRTTQNLLC